MKAHKYCIFNINGGIGKHIAATAVAKAIKNNFPDRKLIVVCAWADIFQNLPYVDSVYVLGQTRLFYQKYVQDKDSLIFHNEPYYTTDHINKKSQLIKTWCTMYNIVYNGEYPDLKFNKVQFDKSKKFYSRNKPYMVIQTNGGPMTMDAKPYAWTRDMPVDIARDLVDHYKKDYHIYQITKINSPKLENAEHIFATQQQSLPMMEFLSILLHSEKRILIDSCLQHAAAAMNKKSTVLWNGTSPSVFGYDLHDNICTNIPKDFPLPRSYLFDFDFNGLDDEYPFMKNEKLYNIDDIIKSINTQ